MEEHHHYGPLNALTQESPAAMKSSVEEQAPIQTGLAYAFSEMDRVHHQIERLRTRLGPISQAHDVGALPDRSVDAATRPRSEITDAVFNLGGSASDAAEKIIEILNYLDL